MPSTSLGINELLCIFQVYPLLFALMSRKTTGAYKAIFKKAIQLGINCKNFISVWEKAERNGYKEAHEDLGESARVWGCIWHFMRVSFVKSKNYTKAQ